MLELGHVQQQEVCHQLAVLLQHGNSQVREAATLALGHVTGDGRVHAIGSGLSAAEGNVAAQACRVGVKLSLRRSEPKKLVG